MHYDFYTGIYLYQNTNTYCYEIKKNEKRGFESKDT